MATSRSLSKSLLILVTVFQQGCAYYEGASLATGLATDHSLTEHAVNHVTGLDCSLKALITDNERHSFYCEQEPNPATTYNRNSF